MPWEATTVIEQRVQFVRDYEREVAGGAMTMTALCERYGIARKTGYKFVRQHQRLGWEGLRDRSRAPHGGDHWTSESVCSAIVTVRKQYPTWGAVKIRDYLIGESPEQGWPAASTTHEILRRAGLIDRRVRPRRYPPPRRPLPVVTEPNELWTADFKGHFRTRDRRYCYPLTVADTHSRYLLACRGLLRNTFELTWPAFERLFRQYGLPKAILTDNGSPFASTAIGRLSKLSVRWIRLGITPLLIEPGKPQQNGRHERMHRTLKEQACSEPQADCRTHQKEFDRFIDHFNRIRPHQALGGVAPTQLYTSSPRPYPGRLPEIEYPTDFEVRRVRSSGEIKWQGQWVFLSDALIGEPVGFQPIADGVWLLFFGPLDLAVYSERHKKLLVQHIGPAGKAENASRFPLSHRSHD